MGCINSCIPFKSVDFEIMRPAHVKLGSNYNKVEILCDYCENTSAIYLLDSVNRNYTKVSLNFIYTLKENLQKSPIFPNTEFSLISSDSLLPTLKNYKARSMENGLIIILDSIYLKDTVIIQNDNLNNKLFSFAMAHKFRCRTYDKRSMMMVDNYLLKDTLFWDADYSDYLLLSFPEIDEAIWDTGISAGVKYSHYLAPYWVDQSRDFYIGNNKSFKSSYKLIQLNNLDSAIYLLNNELSKNTSKLKKEKELHNLAVAYELKDDLTNALVMADSSYKIKNNKIFKKYAEKLRLRKLDKIALDWQLN